MDMEKIDELLKTNLTAPQLNSLPNTIITLEQGTDDPIEEVEKSRLLRAVVTDLNAFYMFNGKYQPLSFYKEKYPELEAFSPVGLQDFFKKANRVLDKRGLPPYQLSFIKTKQTYDPDFIGACSVLADFSDKRPVGAKLKEIGVTTAKWNNWLKSKRNYDYWHNVVNGLMDREVYEEGRLALAQNVARGDLASIKYFNELTDKFVASKEFDPRIIGVLMTGVLDIIMRHVDGTVASKIAEEIQLLGISSLGAGTVPIEANSQVVDLD